MNTSIFSQLPIPSYEWDTTTVEDGPSYWIKVVATCSEGLTAEDLSHVPFIIQNLKATTTTLVGAFSIPGWPMSMLFATIILILVMIPLKRVKRKHK